MMCGVSPRKTAARPCDNVGPYKNDSTPRLTHAMSLFQLRQSALLLITAFIWGCSFVAQSVGMDSVGPFTFTSGRMALGVIVLLPLIFWCRSRLPAPEAARRRSPEYKKNLLVGGGLCGLCLFGGESLQQFGLVFGTEVGKAGFITALYIVLVPLLGLFVGRRTTPLIWAGVATAVVGLWYLCIPPEGFTISAGDFFIFLCALVFSLHILVISFFVTKVDAVELSVTQFAVGSVTATIAMMLFEHPTWEGVLAAAIPILWAGVMSNGIAYTLQIVGQRGMNETVASLILSLESVVSVLAGWALLNEILNGRELFGCALMAVAVVLAQLPMPSKKPAKKAKKTAGAVAEAEGS